jgi:hypothetical protein
MQAPVRSGTKRRQVGAQARKSGSSRKGEGAKQGAAENGSEKDKMCTVRGCGRRSYARGLCQTHHRQLLQTGKVGTIRPYRPRSGETVKFAGLRLSDDCAEKLESYALRHGIARGAAIADILEAWNKKRREEAQRK